MYPSRVVAVLSLATLVGACTVETYSYTFERYGTATGVPVRLGCNDTYEVFDRPDAGSLLVATNAINETLSGVCADGFVTLPLPERLRRVARIFLDEKTNRESCVLSRETPLAPWQVEFNYRCPLPRPMPGAPARHVRS